MEEFLNNFNIPVPIQGIIVDYVVDSWQDIANCNLEIDMIKRSINWPKLDRIQFKSFDLTQLLMLICKTCKLETFKWLVSEDMKQKFPIHVNLLDNLIIVGCFRNAWKGRNRDMIIHFEKLYICTYHSQAYDFRYDILNEICENNDIEMLLLFKENFTTFCKTKIILSICKHDSVELFQTIYTKYHSDHDWLHLFVLACEENAPKIANWLYENVIIGNGIYNMGFEHACKLYKKNIILWFVGKPKLMDIITSFKSDYET